MEESLKETLATGRARPSRRSVLGVLGAGPLVTAAGAVLPDRPLAATTTERAFRARAMKGQLPRPNICSFSGEI